MVRIIIKSSHFDQPEGPRDCVPGFPCGPSWKSVRSFTWRYKTRKQVGHERKTNPGLFFPFIHRTGTHQSNSRALKETCGLEESRGWIAGIPFRLDPIAEPYEWVKSGNERPGLHFVLKPMENIRILQAGKWTAWDAFRLKTNGKQTNSQARKMLSATEFRLKTIGKTTKSGKPGNEHCGQNSSKNH